MRIFKILTNLACVLALLSVAGQSEAAPSGNCVALTFDDGPDVTLTPRLLDILKDAGVKATFFVVGQRVVQHPEIVRRAYQEGNEIGNHSWSHPILTQLSNDDVAAQLTNTDRAIYNATGTYPIWFRAPYGNRSVRIDQIADRPDILWDIDTLDWKYHNVEHVTDVASHSGSGVILMHDIHATTIAAVPGLIAELRRRGYIFGTLSQYYNGTCGGGIPNYVAVALPKPPAPAVAAKPAATPSITVVAVLAVVRAEPRRYRVHDDEDE